VIEKRQPDEVLRQDLPSIAERAVPVIQRTPLAEMMVGPINVFSDAIIMEVHDGGAVARMREALAEAVSPYVEVTAKGPYLPHVTTAVFGEGVDAAALREALPAIREAPPVTMAVRRVELLRAWYTGIEAGEVPELDTVRSYALRE